MGLPAPVKASLRYIRRNFVAIDQLGNALTGGQPDETISYRAAKARAVGDRGACVLCGLLDLFQQDHCAITLANNDKRRTLGVKNG